MKRARTRGRVHVGALAGLLLGSGFVIAVLVILGRQTRDTYVTVNDSMTIGEPQAHVEAAAEFGATQGGVQDMGQARELIQNGQIPPPAAFTVEGMFSEHDLPLSGAQSDQLFQLRAASAVAPGPDGQPAAWIQVGMSSNLDVEQYQRPSLTLVACVDVSGSMGWDYQGANQEYPRPGALARKLLHAVAKQLGPQDRFALVTYGSASKVVLPFVQGDAQSPMHEAIDGLATNGSTNMEAGLSVAYQLAAKSWFDTDQTRVMLFTDEQPNVGLQSTTGFEMMVEDGAERGVGLTVFGLGLGLGSELMKSMSHTWGANAFSTRTADEIDALMSDSWPWMVSPIAYDLKLAVHRAPGFTLVETYGFPTGEEGALPKLEVSTIFLSKRRGGLLLCFQPEQGGDPRHLNFSADLSYLPPKGPEVQQHLETTLAGMTVTSGRGYSRPSVQRIVALAMLVEGMKQATASYGSNAVVAASKAQDTVTRFQLDTAGLGDPDLDREAALASKLHSLIVSGAPQGSLYGVRSEGR